MKRTRLAAVVAVVSLVQGACGGSSASISKAACDGRKVEVEGVQPGPAFWKNPIGPGSRVLEHGDQSGLAFSPVIPRNVDDADRTIMSSRSVEAIERKIAWTYRDERGRPFIVVESLGKGLSPLRRQAARCRVVDDYPIHKERYVGYSMTKLRDQTPALLIAQSIVMSVEFVAKDAVTHPPRGTHVQVVVRAPGNRFEPSEVVEVANSI